MQDFEPDDTAEIPVYVDPVPPPKSGNTQALSVGIVIGVLFSVLIVAGTAAGVLVTHWPNGQAAPTDSSTPSASASASPSSALDNLKAGQCYLVGNDSNPVAAVVPCSGPHTGEVVGTADLGGASDGNNLDDLAARVCEPVFAAYVGTSPENSSYSLGTITPDPADYVAGNHTVICTAETDKNKTGSAKGSEHAGRENN